MTEPASSESERPWLVGEIPFHVGARDVPTNAPLPQTMAMQVSVNAASGALVQIANRDVEAALERAYTEGSQIGTPLSAAGLGRASLEDFMDFIGEAILEQPLLGARVLEIGCGTGALLTRLGQRGAEVVGVEPGLQAAEHARAAGAEVIAQPFQPELFPDRRFDLIVHYGVLEHIARPVEFLRGQLSLLADNGVIVCSVPDCSLPISKGDLSMLVHEHLSYFTAGSLERTGALAGARTIGARRSQSAGAMYCGWAAGPGDRPAVLAEDRWAGHFLQAAPRSLRAVQAFAERLSQQKRTLGIFCPARFINYQALAPVLPRLRYFDDDPLLEGRYYPPFDVRVEARAGLLAEPVDEVLVMSWTFGEHIARDLRSRPELAATAIHTVAELLGDSGEAAPES
jgi:2-polyprenyl-3-methyl-5-hydroxy-6-metoxy-1,4-benzoquinol methylase